MVITLENSSLETDYAIEFQTYLDEFPESDEENQPNNQRENKQNCAKEHLLIIKLNETEKSLDKIDRDSDKQKNEESEGEEEFMEVNISNFDNLEMDSLTKPKHLYDCLLGLRSDNKERLEISLKYLAYLIRKNLEDLDVLSEELIGILLKINEDSIEFQENRKKAICALVIMQPEKISK